MGGVVQLFQVYLEKNIIVSSVILAVLFVRVFLRKFPKKYSYILWAFVGIRMVFDMSISSAISLFGLLKMVVNKLLQKDTAIAVKEVLDTGNNVTGKLPEVDNFNGLPGEVVLPGDNGMTIYETPGIVNYVPTEEITSTVSLSDVIDGLMPVLTVIWIVGIIVILGYGIVTYVRCKQMVKQAVKLQKNVWECDTISSPFVLGIISPQIYIPFHMKEEEQKYILAHERYHIRRRDYLVKPFAFILLAIYWLNPLSWAAFCLMSRDMEMSCDEAVLEKYGTGIKKLYSSSLLSFAEDKKRYSFAPISFGEADAGKRIRNVLHFKKPKLWLIILLILLIAVFGIACLTNSTEKTDDHVNTEEKETITSEAAEKNITDENIKELELNIHIDEHYSTIVGNSFNLYYIDDNHILWGSGANDFGQLGQGTVDKDFHEEPVKIAENVIHVDNSNIGYVIYLTQDHKLYGIGNNCGGALLDNKEVSQYSLTNPHLYGVSEPKLLMSHVKYAKCGQNDIVCILEDNTAWRWGTVWHEGTFWMYSVLEPEKILDNVALVTGGWYNHAALLTDGSVWTWGYNYAGNCGVKDEIVVSEPTKAAEDVVMVWTGAPSQVDTRNISDLSINLSAGENTIIRKKDGSYWACGADLGEEKVLPRYWEVNDHSITCTSEFVPIYNEYAIKHDDQISENIIMGENSYNIPIFSAQEKENEIYKNAVIALEKTGYLPDGTYCYVSNDEGFDRQKAKAYPNKIAVSDVNNDGAKELLIWIGGTCNADLAQYIYQYSKEKECFELLFEYYAGYDFYSNGLICANVSHSNYIYADDFWPYEVFEYNLQTGQYEKIAGVEELDLNMVPADYEENFPFEYDKDGDKKIYLIGYRGENLYLDEEEYIAWKDALLFPGSKVEIKWYSLSMYEMSEKSGEKENIVNGVKETESVSDGIRG